MSDTPLYFSKNIPHKINPLSIVPTIKQQKGKKKSREESFDMLPLYKQKKITKKEINRQKNYRTKMCPEGRECRHRLRCRFAHTQQQLRKPFILRKNPCINYQRGRCSLGSACRDYHGNIDIKKNYKYKNKICEQFLEGKCQRGQFCINIHPHTQKEEENFELAQKQIEIEKGGQMIEQQLDKKKIIEINKQDNQIEREKEQEDEQNFDGLLSINF